MAAIFRARFRHHLKPTMTSTKHFSFVADKHNSIFNYSERAIFILGAPRSGTTWLGKIFDAHPAILYRHEPDILVRRDHIPFICDVDQVVQHRAEAASWLNDLASTSRLKSSGTFPIFRKSFHTTVQSVRRLMAIMSLKAVQRVPGISKLANSIDIPDFVDLGSQQYKKIVIKSVSGLGRAGLIVGAAPNSRIILLIRHPCGQVASMIRGIRMSMFEHDVPLRILAQSSLAPSFGLTDEILARESIAGQLAWNWVIHNEAALRGLRCRANVKIVRYLELAEAPEDTARMLFRFCDLDWRPEVTRFINRSTQARGDEAYYRTIRDPKDAMTRWRRELSEAEITTIRRIATQSTIGKLFLRTRAIL